MSAEFVTCYTLSRFRGAPTYHASNLQDDGADADPAGGFFPVADFPGPEGGADAPGHGNAANAGLAAGAQPPVDANGPDTMV